MNAIRLNPAGGGFDLTIAGRTIVQHRPEAPAFFLGTGRPDIQMYRGNFEIEDRLDARIPLRHAELTASGATIHPTSNQPALLTLTLAAGHLHLACPDPTLNRFWLRTVAERGELLWGAGEQMSYFNLAGRRFPLWTSEPGVGRDKSTLLTFQADSAAHAGGDYWTTNYPQPTYVSSRRYALHVETSAYSCFDFRDPAFHEIEVWEVPIRLELYAAPRFTGLVAQLSLRFGRPPRLPDWAFSGAILGLKDGLRSFDRMERSLAAGAVVTGLWCEDWAGIRVTSFGNRLFWDWQANDTRYPNLRQRIAELAARGIRFLAYVNPYLATDGSLYAEAQALGHLALQLHSDDPYLVDFGEFFAAIVDFTSPPAAAWFAERVLGQEMLDLGIAGWMADFGEYLPIDVRLADGTPGLLAHNAWPVLWAEVNARAIISRNLTGQPLFFMRAGFSGISRYCPLLWAGDQSVDFSRHDGLPTVLRAALSSGLLGNPYHHSDLGGYTSLFGNVRTPELLMRWAELAAFSPVMRSHEGNRPAENLQLDGDPQVLAHFARMSRIHAALAPYVATLCDAAEATGLPLQRPLFLDFEDDPACWEIETQYTYGPDLLVAPVLEPGARTWPVYLPLGTDWIHLWSAKPCQAGTAITVEAPLGAPPVFYAVGSPHAALFARLALTV